MKRIVFKLAVFLLVVLALMAVNQALINGPLLAGNTKAAMEQLKGGPATAGDFQLAGYWISFNTVYLVEGIALVLFGFLLFRPEVKRLSQSFTQE